MSIQNSKARFDYEIIRVETTGIMLVGSEVKQLKMGKATLVDSFCYFNNSNELYVKNFNIQEVKTAFSHDPKREKKLLLKKSELKKLKRDLDKNLTIIPLKVYMNDKNNFFKMEIALCRGKKTYDKRDSIKKKDIERDLQRENF